MSTQDIELLKILIERTGYINTYWNFYIIVATTITGIIVSDKIHITFNIRIILTTAFILFALSNYSAINNLNKQRLEISKLIPSAKLSNKEISAVTEILKPRNFWTAKTLDPINFGSYGLFHLLLDIIILSLIWLFKQKDNDLEDEGKG